ncbi:MAG: ARMT1-like domain-containing protein, partial [Candidatus Hydrogenedentes bacterium]|nr:ARMT1-like domain-containing protein [Candidatus Hydrogenedentota bacterium]
DNPATQRRILDETLAKIPAMDTDNSPAYLSMVAYQLAAKLSDNADPYKELKRAQNELALSLEDKMRTRIQESDAPLETALHLAAAGNVIDLGILESHEIDIEAVIEEVLHERFSMDHTDTLKAALKDCNDLLYLLDNAGEIVFDKLLIEELVKVTKVTAVVKGAPMLNDVVRADADFVGLSGVCDIIDNGGAFIGSPLNAVPQIFLDRMTAADVIIGKGQGNYETIDEFDGNIFLILRAKCEIIAKHMGVKFGQVGLISTRRRAAEGV